MYDAYREYSEGGYADRRTVLQGDTIHFFIANELQTYTPKVIQVLADGGRREIRDLLVEHTNSPKREVDASTGCHWQESAKLEIPMDWPSGWYRLEFPVRWSDDLRYVDFIVAEREPQLPVLFIFDMQTAQAYNVYGGGSFYGTIDRQGRWSYDEPLDKLSFLRPLVRSHTYSAQQDRIEEPVWIPHEGEGFRSWLEKNFPVAFVSNDALEQFSIEYISQYKLIVIAGTQEYWSNQQVSLIQEFVSEGGNLFLAANEFPYGAVRFEDPNTFRYFYNPTLDPLSKQDPDEIAILRASVSDPEDFFGISLESGKGLSQTHGYEPLLVLDDTHWAFAGSGFKNGDSMTAVRGFVPGAWLDRTAEGRYFISSARLTPEQVDILAAAPYPSHDVRATEMAVDLAIDGKVNHIPEEIPDHTNSIIALIRHQRGQLFVAPPWLVQPPASGYDLRSETVVRTVIERFISPG